MQTMTPTPRTDAFIGDQDGTYMTEWEIAMCDFARQLEYDITELNDRLIDRQNTLMSQSLKIISLQRVIETIYDRTEGYADGAPDATAHDKLCNEISSKLKPFLK